MKSRILPYIALSFLLVLSIVVLVKHSSPIMASLIRLVDQSHSVRAPFELTNAKVVSMLAEASNAGMQVGDHLVAISGHQIDSDSALENELGALRVGDKVHYTVRRVLFGGEIQMVEIYTDSVPIEMTAGQTLSNLATTFIFLICLPAMSYLLGFYVAFMRPRDPLAWVLLFLLLGIGSIALEGSPEGTLVKT